MTSLILASIGVFLVVIILLVIILLVAKSYLSFGRGYDYDEWRATTENISGWYSAGYVVCQQCVPFIGLW